MTAMSPPSPVRSRRPCDTVEYYLDPDVRSAMLEYYGETIRTPASAVFLVGLLPDDRAFPTWDTHGIRVMPAHIEALWRRGCDIARSLWDREHLVFLLELDYENIDTPAEPYLRPAETFFKVEPAYAAVRRVFKGLSLNAHAMVTGRGYQFTGQIRLDDRLMPRLASLVPETPAWHAGVQARRLPGVEAPLGAEHARAAAGLGLLLEFAAHLVMREAAPVTSIPVVFNGTIVGDGKVGRECVSIDFSHVGDPLEVRHFRVAFSTYQWHLLRPDIFGPLTETHVRPLVTLPREQASLEALLARDRDLAAGIRAARRARVFLPDISQGIAHLLQAYARSSLAEFHRDFYARQPSTAPREPSQSAVPPCIRASLEYPNDLLLKPEHIQHLVRGLMARDWHPADIAALVRAKYEEDHRWGDRWSRMNPRTRAEFDVRVFAGLIRTGLDSLVDFNCVSAQEKDICPRTGCPYDLRGDRDRLRGMARS